jgi:hypothetical protein
MDWVFVWVTHTNQCARIYTPFNPQIHTFWKQEGTAEEDDFCFKKFDKTQSEKGLRAIV